MPRLTIDNTPIEMPEGATVLDAASRLGIAIPTLCHADGLPPNTSCMVCVVELTDTGRLTPACATAAVEGMAVATGSKAVRQARHRALSLLIGDHLGDCVAPCQMSCPLGLNVPRILRRLQKHDAQEAAALMARVPLAATLGRVCHAPCEKVCRRAVMDEPVSIRAAHVAAAEAVMTHAIPLPPPNASTGKRVAIVGGGASGLTAAGHLAQWGHGCTIFERHNQLGGSLRGELAAIGGGATLLDADIERIGRLGVRFKTGCAIRSDGDWKSMRPPFDAVLLATGNASNNQPPVIDGLLNRCLHDAIDRATLVAERPGLFAAGRLANIRADAVHAASLGRVAASSIHQYLTGRKITGLPRPFSVHIGRPDPNELAAMGCESNGPNHRVVELDGHTPHATRQPDDTLQPDGAAIAPPLDRIAREASRCLHCDCRRPESCQLRRVAAQHGVSSKIDNPRRRFSQDRSHADIVYEPGKCIACGLCVEITRDMNEPLGLTFVNRGFAVRVAPPFGRPLAEGLTVSARRCVALCPTGALAWKNADEPQPDPEVLAEPGP